MRFYLCSHYDGRVVLSSAIEGGGATPVPGAAWAEARKRLDMHGLTYVAGYGWYRARRFTL